MARKKHTVGIIGLGFGRAHIPAFQVSGCEVVALCQRNQETARAMAQRYNVPAVFERWEEMLDQAKPDIVVIASPPHLHREIALRALGQGAHVLCEKPLAMTAAEGREMVEAAARARRVAMTGFNWRFVPAMQRFHALVEEGAVGRLFHLGGRWLGRALGRRVGADHVAHGSHPGRPRGDGRHGRAPDRPRALALRRVRARDRAGRGGLPVAERPGRRQARRRGGLLHRAGRAGLGRAGDPLGEPGRARRQRGLPRGLRQPGRARLPARSRQAQVVRRRAARRRRERHAPAGPGQGRAAALGRRGRSDGGHRQGHDRPAGEALPRGHPQGGEPVALARGRPEAQLVLDAVLRSLTEGGWQRVEPA